MSKPNSSCSARLLSYALVKPATAMPAGIDACHVLGRTDDAFYVVTDGVFFYRLKVENVRQHISAKRLEWFETAVTEYEKGLAVKRNEKPEYALSKYVNATWVLPLACHECGKASPVC